MQRRVPLQPGFQVCPRVQVLTQRGHVALAGCLGKARLGLAGFLPVIDLLDAQVLVLAEWGKVDYHSQPLGQLVETPLADAVAPLPDRLACQAIELRRLKLGRRGVLAADPELAL